MASKTFYRVVRAQRFPLPRRRLFSTAQISLQKPATASPSSPSSQNEPATTHFGFETISAAQKDSRVGAVFSSVADSYDTMNDLMSLGIHRLWKDHFVRSLDPGCSSSANDEQPWEILDIAGGTGDIAFRMLEYAGKVKGDVKSRVTVADINADMLRAGKRRAEAQGYGAERLSFLEANAETLPTIPDNSVDLYTVAFGIRNFTSLDKALATAFRVLKPGGLFACLEFSHVENQTFNAVYKRWSFSAIPLIGQVVAGDRDSYQYLVESIERVPTQAEFAQRIRRAGFLTEGGDGGKGWENLTGGIAAIHRGVKPVS